MSDTRPNILPITGAKLPSSDFEVAIQDAANETCDELSGRFHRAVYEIEATGATDLSKLYRSLGTVCSFHPNFGDLATPFRAERYEGTMRSAAPEDLSEQDVDTLCELLERTTNKALRSRLGDVIWIRRKSGHKAAKGAVFDYLDLADSLLTKERWVDAPEFYRRALQLASKLGKRNELFATVEGRFLSAFASPLATSEGFFANHMLVVALRTGIGDTAKLADIAKAQAARAAEALDPHRARSYYELEAEFAKSSDTERAVTAKIAEARTYVEEAEMRVAGADPSYSSASHLLIQGIEALRQAGEEREVTAELRKRLRDYQRRSMREMKSLSIPVGPEFETAAEKAAEAASSLVSGETFEKALWYLAHAKNPVDPEIIRQGVLKNAANFPLSHLFGETKVATDGRYVLHQGGIRSAHGAELEEAIEVEMFSHASQCYWGPRASLFIEPARRQIWQEHHPTFEDIRFLVHNNPFVPPGHYDIFVRGLYYGLAGDLLLASHLLTPQIENSIRHVLSLNGVDVSNLESNLTQPVKTLGVLLDMEETRKFFGPALCFELRGLLVEKTGYGFRNNIAHGFVSMSDCFGEAALNVWWLVLKLCYIPVAAEALEEDANSTTE